MTPIEQFFYFDIFESIYIIMSHKLCQANIFLIIMSIDVFIK